MSLARRIVIGLVVLLTIGLVVGYFSAYRPLQKSVDIGAAMLAKQVCSCIYVANRDVADCRADQFEMMDRIRVEVLRDAGRVRAWVPGLGERTAVHRDGFGCTLE